MLRQDRCALPELTKHRDVVGGRSERWKMVRVGVGEYLCDVGTEVDTRRSSGVDLESGTRIDQGVLSPGRIGQGTEFVTQCTHVLVRSDVADQGPRGTLKPFSSRDSNGVCGNTD